VLAGADLTHASLAAATLSGGHVAGSLTGARFEGASLAGAALRAIEESRNVIFDGADASGIVFESCTMPKASLRGANLTHSTFRLFDLEGVLFSPSTVLNGATFDRCDLIEPSLDGVRMDYASFLDAHFTDASFAGAPRAMHRAPGVKLSIAMRETRDCRRRVLPLCILRAVRVTARVRRRR
jgi:uncharacterized protein YjbI with pentapeptide repeats